MHRAVAVVGEAMLQELVKEAKATEQVFRSRVRMVLRRLVFEPLSADAAAALAARGFRCNNTGYRPIRANVAWMMLLVGPCLRWYSTGYQILGVDLGPTKSGRPKQPRHVCVADFERISSNRGSKYVLNFSGFSDIGKCPTSCMRL